MCIPPLAALKTDIERDLFSRDELEQKLLEANQYYTNPDNVKEVVALVGLFLARNPSEKEKLSPLLHSPLYQLPPELVVHIFHFLSLPELLKLRRLNPFFRSWIDSLKEYRSRIAYHFLLTSSPSPRDELKFYWFEEQLAIEVVNSLCLFHLNKSYSEVIPLISRLVVKNPTTSELENLIAKMESSDKIALSTLHLCDCQLATALYNRVSGLQKKKTFQFSLHNLQPEASETPVSVSAVTVESLLMNESDCRALKDFKDKVEDASCNEVLKAFEGLNPWAQIPIIYTIWYSSVMGPYEPIPPHHEIKNRVIAFIASQPHHAAIQAAIRL